MSTVDRDIKEINEKISALDTKVALLRQEQDGDPKKFEELEEKVQELSKLITGLSKKYDKAVMFLQMSSGSFKWGIKAIATILSAFLLWKEHKSIAIFIKDLIK